MSRPFWLDRTGIAKPLVRADSGRPEVAVIGAGVTGCFCALTLARAGVRVRVYEAREIASGASGRNGGFALRGLRASYNEAQEQLGSDAAKEIWEATEVGLQQIKELAGDAFRATGSVRYTVDDVELVDLRAEYEALASDGFPVRWFEDRDSCLAGISTGAFVHINDGALDPARWIWRLAALAASSGVEFTEHSRVESLDELDDVEHVVIATDGYTAGLVEFLDALVTPVRSQVFSTVPLDKVYFASPYYGRNGYDYFQQTVDARVVIGGRRDRATGNEFVRDEGFTSDVQGELESLLFDLLGYLPEITHRWAGIFGATSDGLPLVGRVPGHAAVWVAAGYCGHGNVLGLLSGEAVAQGILGEPNPLLGHFTPQRFF